jgi:hypothetical protein
MSQNSASPTVFPIGNAEHDLSETKDVSSFARLIEQVQKKSVDMTWELARIINAAKKNLPMTGYRELARNVGMSPGTFSKFVKIHSSKYRYERLMEKVPSAWTVVYAMGALSDKQFTDFVAAGLLRPDTTVEDITAFMESDASAVTGKATSPIPTSTGQPFRDLAIKLQVPSQLPIQRIEEIKNIIQTALKGQPVTVSFPLEKKKASAEAQAALAQYFDERLKVALTGDADIGPAGREVLLNATWQYWHRQQKKTYPYQGSEQRSVEHPDHEYGVRKYKGPKAFFDGLKSQGIFTPYHPVKDMPGEARCYKYAHQYCAAASSKAKNASMGALKAIQAAEPQHSALAQECIEILARGEVPNA